MGPCKINIKDIFVFASLAPVIPKPTTSSVNCVTPVIIFLQPIRFTFWLRFITRRLSWIFFNFFFSPTLIVKSLMCFYSFFFD